MPQPRSCAGFTQKAEPRRFITDVPLTDDLQCHGATQIDIERLVSDPHCAATQFDRFPVFAHHQLVVVKSLRWLFRRRLDSLLERRRTGLRRTRESPAKHAHRAELHCSRELIAAARAGTLGIRAHVPSRSAESNAMLVRVARNRPARSLANCCPGKRTIAYCNMLARQMTFWKGIPAARVPTNRAVS
jgi:hypothetical protein